MGEDKGRETKLFDKEIEELWSSKTNTDKLALEALAKIGSEEAPGYLKKELLSPEALIATKRSSAISWLKPVSILAPALVVLLLVASFYFPSKSVTSQDDELLFASLASDDSSDGLPDILEEDLMLLEEVI